jgi:hypothetical protein
MLRLRMGDDNWSDVVPEFVVIAVLFFLFVLISGCNTAQGDLIVMWHDVGVVVSPQNSGYVVEIGTDLAGTGRPLGWVGFYSTQENGGVTQITTGSYSDRYGTEYGVQSLKLYAVQSLNEDMVDLVPYGTPIGEAQYMTDFARIWGENSIFPSTSTLYVMLAWESWLDQNSDGSYGQVYSGKGWISLSDIVTAQPLPGMDDQPSYKVGRIMLTTGDAVTGEIPVVPEPGTWCAVAVACGIVLYRRWRRK